ncbi:hypothetical protein JTE90_024088 [Oedothorax gibbosus]|uniref:Uncharacterized protein n=1 Tax=Oedothorax gibbosus TaxID=931172 RepID=A0AAV6USQ6_9ARAC|nr:hypothetical protein JTE90_024088 [Oedothorax gibbosus]
MNELPQDQSSRNVETKGQQRCQLFESAPINLGECSSLSPYDETRVCSSEKNPKHNNLVEMAAFVRKVFPFVSVLDERIKEEVQAGAEHPSRFSDPAAFTFPG